MERDLEFLVGIKKESYTLRRVAGEPSYTIVVYGPEGMLDNIKNTLEKFGLGGKVVQTADLEVMGRLVEKPQVDCAIYHAKMEQNYQIVGQNLKARNGCQIPVIKATLLEYGCLTYSPELIAAERDNFERMLKEALEVRSQKDLTSLKGI